MRVLIAAALLFASYDASAATIQFVWEAGFFDNTSTAPVGGNTGTTLGQQRRIVFEAAAQIWADTIESDVPIIVEATFDSFLADFGLSSCTNASAMLGFAGAALEPSGPAPDDPWFPFALFDAIVGSNATGGPDIIARFNADIDDGCFNGAAFYYGINGPAPSGTTPLFNTVLHELAHGLGFGSALNRRASTGQLEFLSGRPSVFDTFVLDTSLGKTLDQLTPTELQTAGISDPNLVWSGAEVTAVTDNFLTAGTTDGQVRIHAPATFENSISINHFSSDVSPDLLMEPQTGAVDFDQIDLTPYVFRDLGYTVNVGLPPGELIFADGFESP